MLKLRNLVFRKKIGAGAFGKVFLVSLKRNTPVVFACKILNRRRLLLSRQADQLENEIKALRAVNGHIFIAKLISTVRDTKIIGLVMDYISGGELFYWLRKLGKFSEYATHFYAIEILVALDYIHSKGLLYRDLKPENILLTPDGHIKLTDFGFALSDTEKTHIISGTPEYMSPEKLLNEDDGVESDYWSFGIILFEMLTGDPPFYDDGDSNKTYRKVLENDIYIPKYLSYAAADLLGRLLRKKRQERLGYWGFRDLQQHIFFNSVEWEDIDKLSLTPPIVPRDHNPKEYEFVDDEIDQVEEPPVHKKPYEYIKVYNSMDQ